MKAILAVAVLAMAAFAGVMIVGDDADADTNYTITYKGELGIVTQTGAGAVTLNGPAAVSSIIQYDKTIYKFIGWMTESTNPVVYKFTGEEPTGSEADARAGPSISLSEDMTLVPAYELRANANVVFLKLDGVSYMIKTSEGKVNFASDAEDVKAFLAALKVKEDAGFKFDGYYTQESEPSPVPVNEDQTMSVADGKTYEVRIHMAYEVKYVVEGTTILTVEDSITIKLDKDALKDIPVAPSKENHVFTAWTDKDGKEVITYTVDGGYKPVASELKFTEDTVLYAAFTPNNMTVTFVVGEFSTTQTVLYGALAMKPELPAGYVAWVDAEGAEFDFSTPIKANITLTAKEGEPVTVYTVTFEIDGKAPVTQRSDSMVLPDTTIEGKVFQGWVVKGESQYVSPLNYDITGDITFVAVYKEADPPAGPSFFQTTEGKCVAVLIAVVIIAFVYAVYSNMFGLKDALTSVKITRVKK